jgi:hypothetical protein
MQDADVSDYRTDLLTLYYSSKINGYLYHQRVSPPVKKNALICYQRAMLPFQSGVTALCR